MRTLERSPARDAAIAAMLPYVPEHGWSTPALRLGLNDIAAAPDSAVWMFGGPAEMVEAYIDWADRRMAASAPSELPARITDRVRALIALRLDQAEPERAAVRRAAALLCLPGSAAAASRSLARTVDAIWFAAGDRAADWNWYTKRATLAAIYAATLLRWLGDTAGGTDTLAFLDRRLAGLGRIARLRKRLTAMQPARA